MTSSSTSPEEYLDRPYSRVLIPDEQTGTYTAHILEFPGCVTEGGTPQEAYERLEQVASSWIQAALDMGQEIPLPSLMSEHGGRIALRLPKSLHRQAALYAERDGTSLNQFVVMAVSEKVGAVGLYVHLVENFERRAAQTVANFAGIMWTVPLERYYAATDVFQGIIPITSGMISQQGVATVGISR